MRIFGFASWRDFLYIALVLSARNFISPVNRVLRQFPVGRLTVKVAVNWCFFVGGGGGPQFFPHFIISGSLTSLL
jgi:hypothetical protein